MPGEMPRLNILGVSTFCSPGRLYIVDFACPHHFMDAVRPMQLPHLQDVLDKLTIGIVFVDTSMRLTYINLYAAKHAHAIPEDSIGKTLLEFLTSSFDPDSAAHLVPIVKNVLNTGKPIIQDRWESPTEPGFFTEQRLQRIDDAQGNPLGVLITINDVTDYVHTEHALRESEEQWKRSEQILRLAEKAGNVGSWSWEIQTGEVWWSPQSYIIYGVKPEEYDHKRSTWFSFIHPEDRHHLEDESYEIFASVDPYFRSEFRIVRPNGEIRWVEARGLVTYDSLNNPIELVGVNIDITERKHTEDELRQAIEMESKSRSLAQHQSELLQRALLPSPPPAPKGYALSARYVPGTPELDIGGDFYDLLVTEDGRFAILIGDVSGKGVEAASMASPTRATVGAFAYDIGKPGHSLTHASAVIYAQEKQRQGYMHQFVTVTLVVIEVDTGRLMNSSAGHPPTIIRRVDGIIDILPFGQPPVGLYSNTEYTESESILNPGDKMILYTDGISEAQRDHEFFDVCGIGRTLERCGHLSPDIVVDQLIADAQDWAGGTLRDDAVAIVIERLQETDHLFDSNTINQQTGQE